MSNWASRQGMAYDYTSIFIFFFYASTRRSKLLATLCFCFTTSRAAEEYLEVKTLGLTNRCLTHDT
jgi:hypothetical protein